MNMETDMAMNIGTNVVIDHKDVKYNAVVREIYWDKTGVCHCKITFEDPNKSDIDISVTASK